MLNSRWLSLLVLGMTLAVGVCNPALGGTRAEQRMRFLQAEAALRAGHSERFRALVEELRTYPLYPYLRYAELGSRLALVDAPRVEQFLLDFPRTALTQRLRNRWLHVLAANKRWQEFLRHADGVSGSTLNCHRLNALLNTDQEAIALDQVEGLWLHARSQPKACDPVFAAWRHAGRLTPALAWARISLAVDAGELGLARYLKRFLPAAEQPSADLWVGLYQRPGQVTQDSLFTSDGRLHELRAWAMLRLARTDVERARMVWAKLEPRAIFSDRQSHQIRRRIGLSLAFRHRPEANDWFATLPEEHVDEVAREWRILSALRHQQWPLVHRYIERLSAEERDDERWRYWWARAAAQMGRANAARTVLKELAGERNYYGFLAADRLSLAYAFNHQPLEVTQAERKNIEALAGVQRARELVALERWVDARREWLKLLEQNPEPSARATLARIASDWGWHGRAIITIAATPYLNDLELRFPAPATGQFRHHATRQRIDTAWALAVARQESAFMSDARSPVGALGLMQIMPATGKYIANQIGHAGFRRNQLLDTEVNIRFGTWYLRHLLDGVDDNPVLATAGYNAGPHRVRRWRPVSSAMEPEIWIETIPFRETRKYVRRVFAYTAIYQRNLGQQPVRLSERFGRAISPSN